ncbi:uncharacterized protein [Maniola hyperantus]|uniref:uncharacterized protein n=1 Tax=Aphantopus hyperantus TaxID=2795564 RepID=UPI003749E89C
MKWLYLSVVRCSLTYAALIWWPRTLLTTAQQELQKFQRQACLAITGCMSTTPTAALEVILGIPPLHIHIKEEATLAALRLKTSGHWKEQNTMHTKILGQNINKEPRLQWKCDRTEKQHILDKNYKINSEKNLDPKPAQDTIEVYTDGSKTKTGTGAGAYCQELNMRISHALGVTDSPLCRACMEVDETPTHVVLECTGVAEQRERHLGSPTSFHEALGNLGGLLGFWSELGWLE